MKICLEFESGPETVTNSIDRGRLAIIEPCVVATLALKAESLAAVDAHHSDVAIN